MCGSGTTCKIAKKLGRNFIGIDMSKEYCQIAKHRTSGKVEEEYQYKLISNFE